MRTRFTIILPVFLFLTCKLLAQCTTLGQTPASAFPVCGKDTFNQTAVPVCVNGTIAVPACKGDGVTYQDLNPYWYQFTCFQAGSLGFLITPKNLNDDYDWQLFDITGRSPQSVYTDPSLAIGGNWSGNSSLESSRGFTGVTGTKASAPDMFVCASNPPELGGNPPYSDGSTFSRMPTLLKGHKYLLMVSHYSGSGQSGYGLSFSGGTASITDTTKPKLASASVSCDAMHITIGINKAMQCSSLVPDGSDFEISPAVSVVVGASGINCGNGFDMDSLTLTLSNPLPVGNYQVIIKNGSDLNTLLDICNTPIPVDDSIALVVTPKLPTPMDSIVPVSCSPTTLELVFKKNIQCASIDPDGSDFVVTGPTPVTVTGARGNCSSGLSSVIDVQLSAPIVRAGTYTITLQQGSDGNTIVDECSEETPAGSFLNFTTADTVSAQFSFQEFLGCRFDSVHYFHNGANGVNQWNWVFDTTNSSQLQNPVRTYPTYGSHRTALYVSNGVCTDSAFAAFRFNNYFKAVFEAPNILCPNDVATFKDSSIGNIIGWFWTFGDGITSTLENPPPQTYPTGSSRNDTYYPVQLVVEDSLHCYDSAVSLVRVLYNCYIAVPSAFTPNGDGLNDYLYPLNAYKADNLEFRVYNRFGQLVFETQDWTRKWDGKINGQPQASGTFVWTLSYTNRDTGKKVFQKGTTVLIR